jgi:hypothetical protein
MNNIKTFKLKRSRIPTALFKSIVRDIDIMLVQYGPPIEHETEEARSRFLSPVSARQLFIRQSKSKFALRSLTVLSLYSTLLLGIFRSLFSKVVSLPKAGWSITSRHLVRLLFFSLNLNSKPAVHKSAWTQLLK